MYCLINNLLGYSRLPWFNKKINCSKCSIESCTYIPTNKYMYGILKLLQIEHAREFRATDDGTNS